MKIKTSRKKLLTATLLLLFAMTFSSETIAQEKTPAEFKEFNITIEKTDNGLKLRSDKGCAWIDLKFSLADNIPQAIDEFGMTQI
jgi:hypothetical protein